MGQPVSCLGDFHRCDLTIPPSPVSPGMKHFGGPVVNPGQFHVRIMGRPVAVVGGFSNCFVQVLPPVAPPAPIPNPIIKGSLIARINNMPIARISDFGAHPLSQLQTGAPTVRIQI
jgi:uncharacterized Zn-binding protein involved in type VI secretion